MLKLDDKGNEQQFYVNPQHPSTLVFIVSPFHIFSVLVIPKEK